jgi:mannose-6-phosphate isomerase-like protein (cupin superfamily)
MVEHPVVTNPDLCVVHSHLGDRISPELAKVLEPVEPATLHLYRFAKDRKLELHGHDVDEYWWFISGTPLVTLWTRYTGARDYQCGPGDLIVLVRGMAHSFRADHDLVYHQFHTKYPPGARVGHISIEQLANSEARQ